MPKFRDLRDTADAFREVLARKNASPMIAVFDKGLQDYERWRQLTLERDTLQADANKASREFGVTKDPSHKERAGELNRRIATIKTELEGLDDTVRKAEVQLPNWIADDVPPGEGDDFEVPIEYRGTPTVPAAEAEAFAAKHPAATARPVDYTPFHHYSLVGKYIDQDTAGKVAQSRFYYEFDELVALDMALSMYAMEFFRERGYGQRMMVTPYALRKSFEEQICYFPAFEDTIFEVAGDDQLVLLPSSEHSIVAYYYDNIIDAEAMPVRVLAWSPCFRREAGSHGKDTRGIFRVKQFHKVEMHAMVAEGQDEAELERMRGDIHDFLDTLGVPSRSVMVPAGDMDKRALKQVDVQCWMPGQGQYRETHSLATLGTWVSEKAQIRYRVEKKKMRPVVNIYATAVAVQRMICVICENHYDPTTNSIRVPEVLQKYTFGIQSIPCSGS